MKNNKVTPGQASIVAIDVFSPGETFLDGPEFLARASKVSGKKSDQLFYEKCRDNQDLLVDVPRDANVLVFPDTTFVSDGFRCVRCLYRRGAKWCECWQWFGSGFCSCCRVVSLTSPLDSVAVVS